ncbi:integral membrane protein GPR180 isoform X2 [Sphaeramia orbicularis]|uniref:Uncharacterized protein n=1 Tax=Sphaeramia orbicularis TaxID=375764 RepID=A0A673BMU7_9TELE|nr:integral membrane protein GPR180 isoform X2 [Sphaeramia orbicularis]
MPHLVTTLVAVVWFSPEVCGKTVTGLFKSDEARQQNGQFITQFMFQGDSGLLVVRVDNVAEAVLKGSRLLLYQDMDPDLDHLSCSQRLAGAQFTIELRQDEHNQTIPPLVTPTAWRALYADKYTCEQDAPVLPSRSDLSFTVLLLNPDSAGNPLEHFSAEEAGLLRFYFLLLLAYFITSCVYAQPLYQALRKVGPMHTVLKVLTTALVLQGCSALCNYIHLDRYSRDGVGIPLMGKLAEVLDSVSQVSLLYLLLSLVLGWTLGRGRTKPLHWERTPASTTVTVGGVITQGVLLLWDQFSDRDSPLSPQTLASVLVLVFRVVLVLLMSSVLYQSMSTERSRLKRDFYWSFSKGCFLWFLSHPVLVLLSVVFNEHQRHKVVTVGGILCQSISMVILYQLFLSRSLYWEVSSLSSVSLPLTMSRTNHRGRY